MPPILDSSSPVLPDRQGPRSPRLQDIGASIRDHSHDLDDTASVVSTYTEGGTVKKKSLMTRALHKVRPAHLLFGTPPVRPSPSRECVANTAPRACQNAG